MVVYEFRQSNGQVIYTASSKPNGPRMSVGPEIVVTFLAADFERRDHNDRTWSPRTGANLLQAGHVVPTYINPNFTSHMTKHEVMV